MNEETEKQPAADQREVNKVIRILNGKPLKYTLHILMKDGTENQMQVNYAPKLDFNTEMRAVMVNIAAEDNEYTSHPICRFDDVLTDAAREKSVIIPIDFHK